MYQQGNLANILLSSSLGDHARMVCHSWPTQVSYHTHPLCNSGPHTPPLTCVCDPHLLCHSTLLLQLTCITDLLPHSTTTSLSKRSGFPPTHTLKLYIKSHTHYLLSTIWLLSSTIHTPTVKV